MRLSVVTAVLLAAVTFSPIHTMAQPKPSAGAAAEAQIEKKKRPVTPGQQAMRDRQKACGAEWQKAKGTRAAEGKTWPKFWSECNKRLKANRG